MGAELLDSRRVVNRRTFWAGCWCAAGIASLTGCGWLDQKALEREAAAVGEKLGRVEAVSPEKPGFRSLIRSRHPYLGLKAVVPPRSLLPEELRSEAGVVVTLVDGVREGLPGDQGSLPQSVVPSDEVLARRISDAAGIAVRISGSAHVAGEDAAAAAAAGDDVNSWLSSWADEMAGEAGVWAGPLDELLSAWTGAAGYRWQYDADAEAVEVVRSETVVFDVHALQGKQTYSVTTATQGSGGDETSGSSSHTVSSEMEYDPWAEVGTQAKAAAGAEGTVSISATSGTVTVSGLPRAIERVRQYLAHVNEHLLRPVTLSVHLYSVRYDKGSDYEVGLSGLLPEAFGSNFQIGVESGSISIVKPVTAGGSTLQATVSALRSVGNASLDLSADVTTVSRVPGVFYELFDRAYLKQVTTTIDDGVRTVSLTPGTVSSGFGLSFVAHIIGANEVLARITATIQDSPEFASFGTVGNAIQLPAGGRRAIVVTQRLARGETLLLTGFRERTASGSRDGTFDPNIPFPDGGGDSKFGQVELALLVTAHIGQSFGISERRLGVGAGGLARVSSGNTQAGGGAVERAVSEAGAAPVREAGG